MVLKRLCVEGLIEKYGNRHGYYRRIEDECKPVDWINAETNYIDFWLPLGLDRMAGVQPGNIMMIAGSKDAGKTAFLLNIAKENRHRMKVHYFNSEMGESEFKLRMSKFDDVSVETLSRDIKMYPRHDAFHAAIKPGEGSLNIIDFLEVTNDFWRVSEAIKQIHQKLDGALCVIGLQKNPHVDLGRGGSFSLEKARLYISLDYGKAKIISCKNFKEDSPVGNPRSYSCNYKLVNGCRIIKQEPGWTSEAKERK
jgi:hypothetical protein